MIYIVYILMLNYRKYVKTQLNSFLGDLLFFT